MDPSQNRLFSSIMNILSFTCICVIYIILESNVIPANRTGFFCNDNSISYPLKDETVSTALLIGINITVGVIVIAFVEKVLADESHPESP